MLEALLTASKPELLDEDGDRTLRGLLYDLFAFGRSLDHCRTTFASYADLSQTQYLMLIQIFRSSELIGINQLAADLHFSGAFTTIEVNRLVAAGLVEKLAHPGDKRRVQLRVTADGQDRLVKLASLQRPVNDELFGMLTREEFKILSGLLARLAANGDRGARLADHLESGAHLSRHRAMRSKTDAQT